MKKEKTECRLFEYMAALFVLLFAALIVFIIISAVTFRGNDLILRWTQDYTEPWYQVMEDGERVPVQLPVGDGLKRDSFLAVETILPEKVSGDTVFCMYANRNVKIYVDDELRASFSEDDNIFPGKNIKTVFVQVQLRESDAGKPLRIEKTVRSTHDGFATIYYGNSLGVFEKMFWKDGVPFCFALLLFSFSILVVIISLFMAGRYQEWKEFMAIGLGFMAVTFWLMVDGMVLQCVTGIYYVDGVWGYLTAMVLLFPFLYFINAQQQGRYEKGGVLVSILMIINLIVVTFLHYAEIYSFLETLSGMNAVLALVILYVMGTMIVDLKRGMAKRYKYVFYGLLILCTCAILEVLGINLVKNRTDGLFLLAGLYCFLFLCMYQIICQIRENHQKTMEAIRANQMKSDFLASMSHEIRTPINAILGMDEMILREEGNQQITEYAVNIKNAGNTLLTIVNDILDFSRIEAGRMELADGAYSLASVINDVVTMIEVKAKQKNLIFVIDIDRALPNELYGDDAKLRQIMLNILNNAVKYTPQGQISMKLSGEVQGEQLKLIIEVEDTGIGIRQEDIGKLFDKFSRMDQGKTKYIEGTGLGLAITDRMVSMMNGSIDVESEYGKGSKFTVTVLQKVESDEQIGDYRERYHTWLNSRENYQEKFTAPKAKILVVDDNQMNLTVFKGLLKETKMQITAVGSGQEMLELIVREHFDLIFLDHMMPQMDGMEALKRSRELADSMCADTPVVALTANAIKGARNQYLEAGFHDYLTKPLEMEQLTAVLLKYLPVEKIQAQEVTAEAEEPCEEKRGLECYLDPSACEKYYGGDKDFYQEVCRDLANECPDRIARLSGFLKAGNLGDYAILIHATKSNAKGIGADRLAELALELENAAKEGNRAFVEEKHSACMELYRIISEAILREM